MVLVYRHFKTPLMGFIILVVVLLAGGSCIKTASNFVEESAIVAFTTNRDRVFLLLVWVSNI